MSKRLTVLGATGSIGGNTLEIVRRFPDRFSIGALAAGRNVALLAELIDEFRPQLAVVQDRQGEAALREILDQRGGGDIPQILHGPQGACVAATLDGVDTVVTAMVGAAGLQPTLAAIDAGKDIALANKETLVIAGHLVMARAAARKVAIVPVDSEHSAIFQCLQGNRREDVDRILLTASGGPFRETVASDFNRLTAADALRHPNWQMGPKITIDSATLMNKGLEVIEAMWLFDLALDQIEVVVHPQSIVHSMVAYRDGTVMAQMGVPDMKGAIAYALSYPRRMAVGLTRPDFTALGQLTFEKPDWRRFPCLQLAYEAGRIGGTMTAVLNAANERAVAAFLADKIGFTEIAATVERTMAAHTAVSLPELEAILDADAWARQMADEVIAARL